MRRNSLLALCLATALVALVSFYAGRKAAAISTAAEAWNKRTNSNISAASFSRASSASDETDLSKARIENITELAFDEAYQLLRTAPPDALAGWATKLERLPIGPAKTAAISTFYRTLAAVDTRSAVTLALNSRNSETREMASGTIIGAAPDSQLGEVARLVVSQKLNGIAYVDFVERWSRFDPVKAAEFAIAHPEGGDSDSNALQLMLDNWAAGDPASAKAWLEQLPPARQKSDVYDGFVSGWFESDRPAALQFVIDHAGEKKFKKAIENMAEILFLESPEGARRFVLDLPKGKAAEAAIDNIEGNASGRFIYGSSDITAEAAAKWLVTLPEEMWEEHIGNVVTRWANQPDSTVDGWLNGMSLELRDKIETKVCLAVDWQDPSVNIKAGLKISDRKLREKTLRECVRTIQDSDSKDALQRAELSGTERAELRRITAGL